VDPTATEPRTYGSSGWAWLKGSLEAGLLAVAVAVLLASGKVTVHQLALPVLPVVVVAAVLSAFSRTARRFLVWLVLATAALLVLRWSGTDVGQWLLAAPGKVLASLKDIVGSLSSR
jgi:hypothetical protein